MAYEITWYLEDRITYSRFTGIVSADEIRAYNSDVIELLDSGLSPIHAIIHHDGLVKIPANVLLMRRLMTSLDHPSVGWLVHVSHERTPWIYAGQILTRMSMIKFRYVRTVDEAANFLYKQDQSLSVC